MFKNNKRNLPIKSSRFILGNSTEELTKLTDNSVDMAFCDPPYNLQLSKKLLRPDMSKVYGVDDDWDKFKSFDEYDKFTKNWLTSIKRILKPDGSLWVIGSYHNIFRIGSILQDLGFWILNDIVWIKTNPMPNFKGTRFTNAHETLIWACVNKKSKYTFNYQKMKKINNNKQMRSDWLINICSGKERLKDHNNKKIHNTQKPEELLHRIILSSTKSGDIVLDPFFGTGTTGSVCKKLGRKFIGIEQNPTYIKEAKKRILNVKKINSEILNEETFNKVKFSKLLEKGIIKVGSKLFNFDKSINAIVLADGNIKINSNIGSIHKIGAFVQKKQSCNGWTFWHIIENNTLQPIDIHRKNYYIASSLKA